ncbi:MAG: hypothetical protein HKL87_05780 [Acidimicrobiaceae bacterium]|nr:hypothetical protein [Acidimicrobiaceae bacterium]
MRVVVCNLHAGVDGWGRATGALERVIDLAPDIAILPESWRGETLDMVAQLDAAGLRGHFAPLARGERIESASGGSSWQPPLAHFTGERGINLTEHRQLSRAQRKFRQTHPVHESGEWGLSLVSRYPGPVEVIDLGRLPRERVSRVLLLARLEVDGHPLTVAALHGAHLSHGSPRMYARVRRYLDQLGPEPLLLGGDFNCWRPLLRPMLPGYQSRVRAKTWPAYRAHSQIDHLLSRGEITTQASRALDVGSDHRALVADLVLGGV